MQEQGKLLRMHNFQLGFDDPKAATESTEYGRIAIEARRAKNASALVQPQSTMLEIKKNNFQIGSKFEMNDYSTISKMAQVGLQNMSSSQRNEQIQQALKTQLELRKSHFNLGRESNSALESPASASLYGNGPNQSIADKEKIQSKMLRGNFSIGDDKNRSMKGAETSYKLAIGRSGSPSGGHSNKDANLRLKANVSVSLGTHATDFVSEAKQMFNGKPGERNHELQELIERNRNPHFKLGDITGANKPGTMTSVMKQQFDFKGNASEIR
jgi:hypothetical protein